MKTEFIYMCTPSTPNIVMVTKYTIVYKNSEYFVLRHGSSKKPKVIMIAEVRSLTTEEGLLSLKKLLSKFEKDTWSRYYYENPFTVSREEIENHERYKRAVEIGHTIRHLKEEQQKLLKRQAEIEKYLEQAELDKDAPLLRELQEVSDDSI